MMVSIPLGLLLINPPVMNRLLNFALKLINKPPLNLKFSFASIIKIAGLIVIALILQGLAFAFFCNSIISLSIEGIIVTLFLFPFARIAGYLSVVVPGGIGIREGIIVYVLSNFMPISLAVVISFGYRILFLLARILPTIIALMINSTKPKTNIK